MSQKKLGPQAAIAIAAAFFLYACNDLPANVKVGTLNGGGTQGTGGDGAFCPGMNTSDRSNYCLALKYVAYTDSSGSPVVNESQARGNLTEINRIWSQCGIGFGIEQYLAVTPADYSLSYSPAGMGELTTIRSDFQDNQTLLVATTGAFSGLGADAWTQTPPSGPFGAIIGGEVGTYGQIIAHELGHYLSLDHVSDTNDVMNPVIYDASTNLYSSQCSAARSAVESYWTNMLRT